MCSQGRIIINLLSRGLLPTAAVTGVLSAARAHQRADRFYCMRSLPVGHDLTALCGGGSDHLHHHFDAISNQVAVWRSISSYSQKMVRPMRGKVKFTYNVAEIEGIIS